MNMRYIEMRAVGLTVDAELKFPLLMLKNDTSGRVFPISLDHTEKNFLLNTLINRCNLYTGLIRQLIEQCDLRVTKILLDENERGELIARAILRGPQRHTRTIHLSPKEGVLLAMEFTVPVQVAEPLFNNSRYFTRVMPPETEGQRLAALIAEPWFADEEELPRTAEKEDTLQ